jgi:hypothetical protein
MRAMSELALLSVQPIEAMAWRRPIWAAARTRRRPLCLHWAKLPSGRTSTLFVDSRNSLDAKVFAVTVRLLLIASGGLPCTYPWTAGNSHDTGKRIHCAYAIVEGPLGETVVLLAASASSVGLSCQLGDQYFDQYGTKLHISDSEFDPCS